VRQLPGERAAWVATAQRADGHCQKLVCFCVFWDEQENCQPHWGSGDADFFQKRRQTRLFAGIDAPPLEKRETQHETYALLLEQVGDRGAVPQRPHAAAAAESAAAGGGGPRRRRRPVGSYWRCCRRRGAPAASSRAGPRSGAATWPRARPARRAGARLPSPRLCMRRAGGRAACAPRAPRRHHVCRGGRRAPRIPDRPRHGTAAPGAAALPPPRGSRHAAVRKGRAEPTSAAATGRRWPSPCALTLLPGVFHSFFCFFAHVRCDGAVAAHQDGGSRTTVAETTPTGRRLARPTGVGGWRRPRPAAAAAPWPRGAAAVRTSREWGRAVRAWRRGGDTTVPVHGRHVG